MNYEGMPRWESDFWDTLMEDQGVKFKGAPDQPFVSPYATEDMLIGEIVEEEQLELDA